VNAGRLQHLRCESLIAGCGRKARPCRASDCLFGTPSRNRPLRKTYELLSRHLRAGCSNQLVQVRTRSAAGRRVYERCRLLVSSLSVVFFGVFLFGCSRPPRRARKSAGEVAVDSAIGRRFLTHLEQRMAEFLSHQSHTTAVLMIALVLVPAGLRAKDAPSAISQTDGPDPTSAARSLYSVSEPNSDPISVLTQTSSDSSGDSKPTQSATRLGIPMLPYLTRAHCTVTSSIDSDRRTCKIGKGRLRADRHHTEDINPPDDATVSVCSLALWWIGSDRLSMDPIGAADAGHLERLGR
jgi:hypothetical protein